MLRPFALAITVFFLASACTVHDRLSKTLLTPVPGWLVEPGELSPRAEPFEIEAGEGSLTGWFLPADGSRGRTVLVFHDSSVNVSMLHPYYTFLTDAGLNVCVFDYRGFGRSKGEPNLRSLFMETELVVGWLRARPDVDGNRIAYYGLGMGSTVALHTATSAPCRALVVENVPSPLDLVHGTDEVERSQTRAVTAGVLSMGLPENCEPAPNAAKLAMPSLWIAGSDEPRDDLRQTLHAYFEMGGDKRLWILPETGRAPHALLTHDGEYQRVVARFLTKALDAAPEVLGVSWERSADATSDSAWWRISLRRDAGLQEPWAVQVCALDAAAEAVFEHAWLDGATGSVRMRLKNEPQLVSVVQLGAVERAPGVAFRRVGTPLSRAGRWYEDQSAQFELLRSDRPTLEHARTVAAEIAAREKVEPLPARVDAQLADVYATIGRLLLDSNIPEDREAARPWLQRAVDAAPAHPNRHFWPGRPPTYGFPFAEEVERARELLAR